MLEQTQNADVASDIHSYLVDRLLDEERRTTYEDTQARNGLVGSIVQLRIDRGLTQYELATACGTTQSAISDFETGLAEPRLVTVQRIARVLGARILVQLWNGPFLVFNTWLHRAARYDNAIS